MIRNRYVFLGDLPLIAAAAFGAFAIRFDLYVLTGRPEFIPYLLCALLVKPIVYHLFGLYQRVWRYAGLHDLLAVAAAGSVAAVIMAVAVAVALTLDPEIQFSRTVIFVDWLLSVVGAGGGRVCIRLVSERTTKPGRSVPAAGGHKRILVVGAGDAGAMVVREIQRHAGAGITFVGFLDDEPTKQLKRIHGLQVLGPVSSLEATLSKFAVDEVIIAMPSAAGSVVRAILDSCGRLGVRSRTVPGALELIDGQVSYNRVRRVEISDLLRREPVRGEVDASSYVAGRTVLVTGAGGSIGQELSRQVAGARPGKLVMLGHGENSLFEARVQVEEAFPDVPLDVALVDIRDPDRLAALFRKHRPDLVIHAAAHKHVPMMEDHPEEAVSNNVVGTRNVVDVALSVDVPRLIMISTDKAVAPRSVMGASKRVAEMIVRTAAIRRSVAYGVVRFGNVLGSRGSVVPYFQRQIERGGPVTITDPDMKRYFMTIPEAVHLVLQAGSLVKGGELFVLEMGEPVRIVDLARDMIRLSSRPEDDIQIVFTGLRRGEKLEETLWEPEARVEKTAHPHVLRVSEPYTSDAGELEVAVARLVERAHAGDALAIEAELARIVATYVPASTNPPVIAR